MTVTIVLADDHQVVRQGVRKLLDSEPDFAVIGETGSGREVMPIVRQLSPNVLVLDMSMPDLSGLDVLGHLQREGILPQTIVLSMFADESYVSRALALGAAGYVVKDSTVTTLIRAVREVNAGRRFLGPPIREDRLVSHSMHTDQVDPYETLTLREREVLLLSAESLTGPEISFKLAISPRTVECHRASIMRKLKLRSQTDLIRFALRRGLVPLTETNPDQMDTFPPPSPSKRSPQESCIRLPIAAPRVVGS